MTRLQTHTLVLFIAVASQILGHPSFGKEIIRPDIVGDVPQEVLDELEPLVFNPSRDAYVYSYQDKSSIKKLQLNLASFPDSAANYFFSQSQDTHLGNYNGLYLAADPISSRDYAGTGSDFVMYRIALPSSTRILDTHDQADISFKNPNSFTHFVAYVQSQGCTNIFLQTIIYDGVAGPACRKVGIKILRALNIDAIESSFYSVPFQDCKPRTNNGWALILIRPDHIPAQNIRIFTSDESQDPDHGKERAVIRALYNQKVDPHGDFDAEQALAPQALGFPGTQTAPDNEMRDYEAEHLMNCANLPIDRRSLPRENSCVSPSTFASVVEDLNSNVLHIEKNK